MKEHFELVEHPINDIWEKIFRDLTSKKPYFTLNKYFLNLLQEMVISELKQRLKSPDLDYWSRIRTLPLLAKSTNQELSLIDKNLDELLERIAKYPGEYFKYAQENFLAALAPLASSAQSKKIIENIITFTDKLTFNNFPGSLNNFQTFWMNNNKNGLYNTLCEHGKNLNWVDANQLAKLYCNADKSPKTQSIQLLILCAFGDKIDENLRKPVTEDLISLLWELINKSRGFKKMDNLCWLRDLNLFITPESAKGLIVELVSDIPTHMEKIKITITRAQT